MNESFLSTPKADQRCFIFIAAFKGKDMLDSKNLVVLDQMLVLTKEGKNDLVYENNTLLKVKMFSNHHIVVEDDQQTSFLLKCQDENIVWSFI